MLSFLVVKTTGSKRCSNVFSQTVLSILLFRFCLQFSCFKICRNILPASLSKKLLHILLRLYFFKHRRHCYLAPKYLPILWCLLPRDRLSSHALDPHPSSENSIKHASSFLYFHVLLCTSVFKHIQGLSVHAPLKTSKLKINISHHSFMPQSQAADILIAFLAVFLPSNLPLHEMCLQCHP